MTARSDLVLVTGVSGFIAKHLASRLLQEGYHVRGTVRSEAKSRETIAAIAGSGIDTSRLEFVVADLDRDESWNGALDGVRFVHHTASPFPLAMPRDRSSLVATARNGTVRVVRAAEEAGVERLILTSSVAAVYYGHEEGHGPHFTEADFSKVDASSISPYAVSKTLAEQAAWTIAEGSTLELATINPALVVGPLLDAHPGTSVSLIRAMMRGRMPFVPNVALGLVDVRDVAQAHVRAMTTPAAKGRRFLLSAGSLSLRDIGSAVADAVPHRRRRAPMFVLPDWAVKLAAVVLPQAAIAVPELGRVKILDTAAARDVLGLALKSPTVALSACARDLDRLGLL